MPPTTPRRRSVLIVEDDRALRGLYRSALRGAGYEVADVEDGTDALRRIEHWTPDILVLDLALPRLGGQDLLKELRGRRETRGIPVVIVTGIEPSGLNSADFVRILRKPIRPDDLVSAVDDATRGIRPEAS